MQSLLAFLLDFIFPPSPEELKLRGLSPEDIARVLPKAPSPPLPFITSLYAYKAPLVAELIKGIKNKKDRHALTLGGSALYRELMKRSEKKILLVPIPISKKRRGERGYNQCELLIEEILRLDGGSRKFEKKFDLLIRTKHSEDQKLKNKEERLRDSAEIFKASTTPEETDTEIILIDDVTTTGSTLDEARKVLNSAGYANVRALTLAH